MKSGNLYSLCSFPSRTVQPLKVSRACFNSGPENFPISTLCVRRGGPLIPVERIARPGGPARTKATAHISVVGYFETARRNTPFSQSEMDLDWRRIALIHPMYCC